MQSFSYLNEIQQADLITERGIFLGERVDEEAIYDLYKMDSFYVEFCYYTNKNVEVRCSVYKTQNRLHPYMQTTFLTTSEA
jgi:hypothetical protein